MKYIFLPLLFVIVVLSCDEVFQYEEVSEPTVTFKFINNDSLSRLDTIRNDFLDLSDSIAAVITYYDSSLNEIADSIDAVLIGLDTGNVSLEPLLLELQSLKELDSVSRANSNVVSIDLTTVINSLEESIASVKSGSILLNYITAIHSGYTDDQYADSLTSYTVPLNVNDTISEYEISFGSDIYPLILSHSNEEQINSDLEVFISISNISIKSFGFDSVAIDCNNTSTCKAYDTEVTCYY